MIANRDSGFSLVEMVIAAAMVLSVAAVTFAFISSHTWIAQSQPEAADVQQRARAAADLLANELANAGASSDYSATDDGLSCCMPALQPRRIGLHGQDAVGTARDDVVTIVRTSPGAVPVKLRAPFTGNVVALDVRAPCPTAGLCGLAEGDSILVSDSEGHHDFFLLGPPVSDSAPVILRQPAGAHPFPSGAAVVAVETRTYYYDADSRQIRMYDGHLSDVPVIDDVVAMRVEYWGDSAIPQTARGVSGGATCWFDADQAPRFGGVVTPPGAPLVRLGLGVFRDGPWCGAGENRFDADLLRIRQVRITVRVAAASDDARGTGALFMRPGRGHNAMRLVPDVEVSVDVTPRNLNADR